jgi:hypothetical protein
MKWQWYTSAFVLVAKPGTGEPGKEVEMAAMPGGAPPKDARYEWDFGDGSKVQTIKNDSTVKHKFTKKGEYKVTVKLYDNASKLLIGQAVANASIQEGILSVLQTCEAIHLWFDADIISNSAQMSYEGISMGSRPSIGSTRSGKWELTWSGTKFSTDYSDFWYNELEKITTYYKFQGEVSANGLMLKTLTAWVKTVRNNDRDVRERSITITDLPFTGKCRSGDERCFTASGVSVSQHLSGLLHTYSGVNGTTPFSYRLTGVNYTNPDKIPVLEVAFAL